MRYEIPNQLSNYFSAFNCCWNIHSFCDFRIFEQFRHQKKLFHERKIRARSLDSSWRNFGFKIINFFQKGVHLSQSRDICFYTFEHNYTKIMFLIPIFHYCLQEKTTYKKSAITWEIFRNFLEFSNPKSEQKILFHLKNFIHPF